MLQWAWSSRYKHCLETMANAGKTYFMAQTIVHKLVDYQLISSCDIFIVHYKKRVLVLSEIYQIAWIFQRQSHYVVAYRSQNGCVSVTSRSIPLYSQSQRSHFLPKRICRNSLQNTKNISFYPDKCHNCIGLTPVLTKFLAHITLNMTVCLESGTTIHYASWSRHEGPRLQALQTGLIQ